MSIKNIHVCDSCFQEKEEMKGTGGLNCPEGWRMFAHMTSLSTLITKELCLTCQAKKFLTDVFG